MRCFGVVVASALVALPVSALAATADEVRAEALFRDGMQKFDAGQVAQACASFTESLRLDPKLGTLLNLALCHEKQGKTATAWVEFNHGAAWATQVSQRDRREFANQHAITLEGQLSRVLLQLPPARELSSVEVDGEPLPEPRWYLPLYLDPGEHTIAVSAPGKARRSLKVTVPREPSAQLIPVPPLQDLEPATPAANAPRPAPAATEPASPGSTQRLVGFVAGGVGLLGVAGGSVLGVMSIGKRDDIGSHCVGSRCDATGISLHDDAQNLATLSTVAFAVGAVGIASGVVLLLTAPSAHAELHAFVGPRGAGLGGAF